MMMPDATFAPGFCCGFFQAMKLQWLLLTVAGNPDESFMAGKTQGKLFVFDVSRILYRMVIRFELKKHVTFDVTFVFF